MYYTAAIYVSLAATYVPNTTPLLPPPPSPCEIASCQSPTPSLTQPPHRIEYFGPELSRFRPRLYYWIFIPGDLVCLVIQAAGGAMSTTSDGASQTGVDLALAGLVLQVVFMVIFCALFADYLIRYARSSRRGGGPKFTRRLRVFFGFQGAATLLILVRCAYRLAELHEGYGGKLVRDEALFIGLEGV